MCTMCNIINYNTLSINYNNYTMNNIINYNIIEYYLFNIQCVDYEDFTGERLFS